MRRVDTWVGVLPLGYGDGVRRGLSNNAEVLVARPPPPAGRHRLDGQRDDRPRARDRGRARRRGGPDRLAGRGGDPRRGGRRAASARSTTRSPAGSLPGCRGSRHERRGAPRLGAGRGAGATGAGRRRGRLDRRRRGPRRGARARGRPTSTSPSPATPRRPRRLSPARAGGHAFELSAEFGTWRAVAADGSWQVDVTALRGETIEADLAARDFTIGAVAVPLAGGEPIDPFGGLADLERGVLRVVGEHSFAADPLRLLRAARLAAELDARDRPRDRLRWPAVEAGRAAEPAGERQLAELRQLVGGARPAARPGAARRARPDRGRPARAGGAARRRAGPQPPPRRPRPHPGRARAHARGRGRPGALRAASAPPRLRRCSPSRSPTR